MGSGGEGLKISHKTGRNDKRKFGNDLKSLLTQNVYSDITQAQYITEDAIRI